jgi:hypothetical protein
MTRALAVLATLLAFLVASACGDSKSDIAKAIREKGGYATAEVLAIEQTYEDSHRSPDDKGTKYVVKARVSKARGPTEEASFEVFIAKKDGFASVSRRAR